jgi:hypothetical protein
VIRGLLERESYALFYGVRAREPRDLSGAAV